VFSSSPAALLAMLLLSSTVFGQADRGTITGVVNDSNGAAVPGATVTVTNQANNSSSTAITSSEGIYVIPALSAGTYKVRVERTGFKSAEIAAVTLIVGNTASANVAMEGWSGERGGRDCFEWRLCGAD
jgi:hypothetical protein